MMRGGIWIRHEEDTNLIFNSPSKRAGRSSILRTRFCGIIASGLGTATTREVGFPFRLSFAW
jgi:hypothetical protein